jgi:hypothetical protein
MAASRREDNEVAARDYPRSKPAIGPWTDIIDAWLEGDESVPRTRPA